MGTRGIVLGVLLAILLNCHGSFGSGIHRVELVRKSQQSLQTVANDQPTVKLLNYLDAQVRWCRYSPSLEWLLYIDGSTERPASCMQLRSMYVITYLMNS